MECIQLLVPALLAGLLGGMARAKAAGGRKAIVVTSFGTTDAAARRACIEGVENRVRQAFPDYDVRRAFTSRMVIRRIADQEGLEIDSLETALERLKAEGYSEVIVQPTHLTPGEEFDNKIVAVCGAYKQAFAVLRVGRPVLSLNGQAGQVDDFRSAVDALQQRWPETAEAVVFMGHGSPHRHNPAYEQLQRRFDALDIPAVVGVLEERDYPNFDAVLQQLTARGVKKVVLVPLLLVAGDHARNDMAGDGEAAWHNRLRKAGIEVEVVLVGLGENPAFQEIYVQHIRDAIAGMEI